MMNDREMQEIELIERGQALGKVMELVKAHGLTPKEVLSAFPQFEEKRAALAKEPEAKSFDPFRDVI